MPELIQCDLIPSWQTFAALGGFLAALSLRTWPNTVIYLPLRQISSKRPVKTWVGTGFANHPAIDVFFATRRSTTMHVEFQQVLNRWVSQQTFNIREATSFSPTEFREGIQWLLANEHPDLAQALAEAGLALYPESEDILAMAGLLAMTRNDWPLAIELLQDLMTVQKGNVQPTTCIMLARALACNLDLAQAHEVLDLALRIWPFDDTLLKEKHALQGAHQVMAAPATQN